MPGTPEGCCLLPSRTRVMQAGSPGGLGQTCQSSDQLGKRREKRSYHVSGEGLAAPQGSSTLHQHAIISALFQALSEGKASPMDALDLQEGKALTRSTLSNRIDLKELVARVWVTVLDRCAPLLGDITRLPPQGETRPPLLTHGHHFLR